MAAERPRGLLLDYAGVLTVSTGEALAAVCQTEGIEPDSVRAVIAAAYTGHRDGAAIVALETGRLPLAEFEVDLAARIRCREGMPPLVAEGLVGRMFAVLPTNPRMWELARHLRAAGVRTALLSNTWGGAEGYERAALDREFDAVVLSHEVGLRKPDPAIYALAAERLGLPAAACVVVDDLITNVLGARSAGMRALLHEDDAATVSGLEELFGVDGAVR